MTDTQRTEHIRHFLEPTFDFTILWENMKACDSRGIYIYDEYANNMVFYSYSSIYKRVTDCAGRLQACGLSKGMCVLLSVQSDIRFTVTWFACIWLGIIPATLPSLSAFFAKDIYKSRIKDTIPHFRYFICNTNEIPFIEEISSANGSRIQIIEIQNLFIENDNNTIVSPERNTPLYDDTAFIQFTSGSSGIPKGIIITYRNVLNNIWAMHTRLEMNPEISCGGNWMPLFHDMGLVGSFLHCIFTQTMLVLVSPFFFIKRMFDFLRMIGTYKINMCCMTNSVLEILLHRYSEEKCQGIRLDSLTWIGIGAEPVNIATLEKFHTIFKNYGLKENVLSPCYGLAESTLAVSIAKPFEGYLVSHGNRYSFPTAGTVVEGTELVLEKNDNCDIGQGLIKIRGNSITTHVLINGDKRKITDDEGFYNTYDIGYFYYDKLVIVGRVDRMFIVSGENFFSDKIEALIIDSRLLQRPNVVCLPIPPYISELHRTEVIIIYEVNRITREEKEELDEKLSKLIIQNTGLTVDRFVAVKRGTILYTSSGKIKYNEMLKIHLNHELGDNITTS